MKQEFITNKVEGTRRYILIFLYDFGLNKVVNKLKKLQGIYKLPSFYIGFLGEGKYVAFCLKTLDFRRCQKIYRASGSLNISELEKYRKVYIPFQKINPIFVLQNNIKNYEYSEWHARFLYSNEFYVDEFKKEINPSGKRLSITISNFEIRK